MSSAPPIDILIGEDDPADAALLRRAFKSIKSATRVHVVFDGASALDFLLCRGEHAQAPRPTLILLDIGLPKVNGFDVLNEIKADQRLSRIPVIMMSGSESDENIEKSYESQAASFIYKTSNPDVLRRIVETLESYWFSTVVLPGRGHLS